MRPECYFCHIKTVKNLLAKFNPPKTVSEDFIFSVHEILGDNRSMINPKLATNIQRIAKQKLNNKDLYASEKLSANKLLLADYEYWRNYIDNSNNPFYTAVRLAVAGNIIDYGAHSVNGDIKEQIKDLINTPFAIDKSKEFKKAIDKAERILYLGDNAGEVFFDRLLLETIRHPKVTFVTRGAPVINDVTIEDAKQVGIDNICEIIDNGFDAPSTLLEFCSDEFKLAYNSADLIISKGQGNFEGLMNEKHPNTFFLLMAKCEPMAEMLGCSMNDLIVTQLN
ncbi:damage-control phosphatase ARMT1 family protein [Carboxylicivirga caseinilyticus]|uniref:damage-control phosphatase ARMT1 family protein n=1 Tax=Carboxylicivirga caseinilyticus TaxID=3417572 RepID=UPI002D1E3444|nr:ARMT1-like domain-containing protein [uncultured Carboxylicivirga sp.]